MKQFFRHIRPLNLLIIIVLMYSLRWLILKPLLFQLGMLMQEDFYLLMGEIQFAILVSSVVFIAAGGYILNDIADIEEDSINDETYTFESFVIQNKKIAYRFYILFSLLGLFNGFMLGYNFGNIYLGLLHLTAAMSLWFYAYYFKGSLLIGNVIIALCAALVPLIVGVYEVPLLQRGFAVVTKYYDNFNFNFLAYWMIGFSVFAFLFTLAREIIKDAQDAEGDRLVGHATLAVKYGFLPVKILVSILYIFVIILLFFTYNQYLPDKITLVFVWLFTVLLAFQIVYVWLAKNTKDFGKLSLYNKLTTLLSIVYAIVLAYALYNDLTLFQ